MTQALYAYMNNKTIKKKENWKKIKVSAQQRKELPESKEN
jgi:hypothetical protein